MTIYTDPTMVAKINTISNVSIILTHSFGCNLDNETISSELTAVFQVLTGFLASIERSFPSGAGTTDLPDSCCFHIFFPLQLISQWKHYIKRLILGQPVFEVFCCCILVTAWGNKA